MNFEYLIYLIIILIVLNFLNKKLLKYKKIYVVKIPNKNIGIAINDRLKHAANI